MTNEMITWGENSCSHESHAPLLALLSPQQSHLGFVIEPGAERGWLVQRASMLI